MPQPLALRPRITTIVRRAVITACALLAASAPARAQHRARLSADLVDHKAAQSARIDVIVHGDKAEVDALAARYNLQVKRYLKTAAVLRVNAGQLAALEQDEAVDHLSGDTVIRSSADVTAESIGADQVWAGQGALRPLTGAGVVVAVIDTGVDTRHPALKDRVVFTKDFTGGDGQDRFGHGTHVAGLIAGAPGRTAATREYSGIAPGARLVNLRALGDDGAGTVSTVVEAIDWAIDHRQELRIRVINLSLGAPVLQPYRDDPLCEAVERAVAAGIAVVASAGNQGRTADGKTVLGSITSPGNSPYAITVGALDTQGTAQRSDDGVAAFSSRGPTRYDLIIKPDLAAPGVRVVSTEAADSYLARTYPARHVVDGYLQLSGTSMAAAVVSGAVALLIDQRPNVGVLTAKSELQFTASPVTREGAVSVGSGSLNVLGAALLNVGPQSALVHILARILDSASPVTPVRFALDSEASENATLWGTTIIWGATIIWGQAVGDTIIWGQSAHDTIIWGQCTGDTIIWGQSAAQTIIWGATASSTLEVEE
jgi:serine protease AprX